jgi:hypothetical protein
MKKLQIIAIIGAISLAALASAYYSRTQIYNLVHNPATHTLQVKAVARGIATPGTGSMTETQILNDTYSNGTLQVTIDSTSSDIPFINYTGTPTTNQVLQYTGTEWSNREGITWPTVTIAQASYTISSNSKASRFFANYSTSSPTINIDTDQLVAGRELQIVDVTGDCDDNPITIKTEGAEKINGDDTVVIIGTRGGVSLLSNGLSWLVNSVAGDVYKGTTVIANGTFDTNTSGWSPLTCTLASVAGGVSGNCLEMTYVSGTSQTAYYGISTEPGRYYRLTVYVKSGTSGNEAFRVYANDGNGTAANIAQVIATTTGGWVQWFLGFRAQSVNTRIMLYKYSGTAGTMLFDEVSIYELL